MRWFMGIVLIAFLLTGTLTVMMASLPAHELSVSVSPFHNMIFSTHLGCWMILGMMANYLWDLFRANRGLSDVSLPALLLPILVSPIVFFAVWSLVAKDDKGLGELSLTWALVAFQNGFFWQVVFSKAGAGTAAPAVRPPDNKAGA
jgi:hypothetical protein